MTGPKGKTLPGLSLLMVAEADSFTVGVTGAPKVGKKFFQRLDACSESDASFGAIEWTITCGEKTLVKKEENSCDPCFGAAGSLVLTPTDAPACWTSEQAPQVAVKFAIDGVQYEATARAPVLSKTSSSSAIETALEAAGVTMSEARETCCPGYPDALERTGDLSVRAPEPARFRYTVFRGAPERFPAGPVCLTWPEPHPTLSYAFASHRYDLDLLDAEDKPMSGTGLEKVTAALDRAFQAAGGRRVKPLAP